MQIPSVYVGAIHYSPADFKASPMASLNSIVKVVDYFVHWSSCLKVLNRQCYVIAMPGKPYSASDKVEHFIGFRHEYKSVYIPAYRTPLSQRQIVEDKVDVILRQGVIVPLHFDYFCL